MNTFAENRPFIENEFQEAQYDAATGLSADELAEGLKALRVEGAGHPRRAVTAEAYCWLLDHVQLQLNPHTPFALKFNTGVGYPYFAGWDVFYQNIFDPDRDQVVWSEDMREYNTEMHKRASVGLGMVWTDFWHTVPGWPYLVKRGFPGILQDAEQSREVLLAAEHDEEQIAFLDGVITCYRGILRFLKRVYDYSLGFDMPQFSSCIKSLTERAPETLYEVMQFSVLWLYFEEIGPERARTLGHIDRMYMPFYERHLKNGGTEEEARELFRYFFIHFTAARRFAEQPFTMGGSDKDGNDMTTPLSMLMLEVYDELNIFNPKIQIRCHAGTPKALLQKALDMIRRGNSSMCLVNDAAVYAGYKRIGVPIEDAQNYVLLGCYEPIVIGHEEAEIGATWLNIVKAVEFAMNGGCDIIKGTRIVPAPVKPLETFQEFMNYLLFCLDDIMDFVVDYGEKVGEHSVAQHPSHMYSSSFEACIQKGRDVHEYPLRYNNFAFKCFGLATLVDSVAMVKKYVYDQKRLTLSEFRDILKADWEGHEELRQEILRDRERYGNNLPGPDEIMCRITKHMGDRHVGRPLRRGGVVRLGLDSVDHFLSDSMECRHTGATPDGRKAYDHVSKNLCTVEGMDCGGITAYMQSVLKIDAADYVNAAPLDFVIHPSAVEGDKGLQDFESLIRIFFAQGGFAAQGNIMNAEMLRAAQKEPEKYANLQVRVCGWNVHFVRLSKEFQDVFIQQCEGSPV